MSKQPDCSDSGAKTVTCGSVVASIGTETDSGKIVPPYVLFERHNAALSVPVEDVLRLIRAAGLLPKP